MTKHTHVAHVFTFDGNRTKYYLDPDWDIEQAVSMEGGFMWLALVDAQRAVIAVSTVERFEVLAVKG